jgi:Arc/MetJ family transcription regulator
MTKPTSIRFDDKLYQEIVDYTTLTEQSVSAFVNEAVATYIAEKRIVDTHKETIDNYIERFSPLLEKLKDR